MLILIDSNYPTRPRMIRNQVVNLWKDTLPPGVARPGGLRGAAARLRTGPGCCSRRPRSSASECAARRSATATCAASWRYRPEPYEGGSIFLACEEREVEDAARVWKDVAAGGLEVRYLPGDTTRSCASTRLPLPRLDECLRRAGREHEAPRTGPEWA